MKPSIRRIQTLAFTLVLATGAGVGLGAANDVLIYVHVTDAEAGVGIPNARVEWATYQVPVIPGSYGTGWTDAAGVYSFRPVYGSGYRYAIDAAARNHVWSRLEPVPPPGEQHYSLALVPINGTPIVDAGPDQVFSAYALPTERFYLPIDIDDPDRYVDGVLSGSKESGPGNVVFDSSDVRGAWYAVWSFDTFGVYELRVTYTDDWGDIGSDTVRVTVQSGAPIVDAGADAYVWCNALPCEASLQGTAYDPDNFPSALTSQWRVVAGPGGVLFANDAEPTTSASFSVPGVYTLELVAGDGKATASDQVEITVGTGASDSCAAVSHWKLDDGAGAIAGDSQGGHDGVLIGPVQWGQGPSGFGGAAVFHGSGRIEVVDEAAFDLTDALTVAAWVNLERVAVNWAGVVAKGDSAWRLSTYLNQPRLHFAVTGAAAGANGVNGSIAVDLNEWHHVAGTFDSTQIRLYVDGLEDPAGPVAYAGSIGTNDFPVWIGSNAEWPDRGFIGALDDVRIYNCALSQDRIIALMSDFSAVAFMRIREVIDNGVISDQNDCYRSLDSGLGTIVEYNAPVLNLWDFGGVGHFGVDDRFGVVREGLRVQSFMDYLSLRAEGVVRIPAGRGGAWTFGVNSDDGFTLQFPGHDFLSVVNGEIVTLAGGATLRFFGGRAASDTFGTISLPAGDHPFWLTYHEDHGGAAVELFAAQGTHTTFDPEVFRLVGRLDIGAVATPGLCADVTMEASRPGAWSGGLIDSLADATAALAQGRAQRTNLSQHYGSVNHKDPDVGGPNSGIFANDTAFPNDAPGRDENDFAVQVTGLLDIPVGGLYQIGFNSDDGALLRIPGQTWRSVVTDSTGQAVMAGDELRNDALTGWSFTAGEIELPAGCHGFEVILFERAGSAFIELFGRGVSTRGIADPMWHLLKAGGASPPAPIEGLQLVDPASTLDLTLPGPGGR